MLQDAIKKIEAKGYIVHATENRWLGKLNEDCPVVYDIYYPNHDRVYGSNGASPESLETWAESLEDLTEPTPEAKVAPRAYPKDEKKAKEWDEIYNEGGEGYNPYR